MADGLRRQGLLDEAESVIRSFLGHAPGRRAGEFVLARVLLDMGRVDEAVLLLDRLYPRDSENVALTQVYAEALIESGRYADARAVIERGGFIGVPADVRERLLARIDRDTLGAPAVTLPGAFLQPMDEPVDAGMREIGPSPRGAAVADGRDPFAVPVVLARIQDEQSPGEGPAATLPLDQARLRAEALRSWASRLGLEGRSC